MAWPTTSAASRGYGTAWKKLREEALKRDRYLCQVCKSKGRVTVATEVDHIVPKSVRPGANDTLAGIQSICSPCHQEKTMREQGKALRPVIGLDGYPIDG